jgi:ribonuclease HI
MEDSWPIPALEEVRNTGSEWLLQLLMEHEEPVRAMILMTFWRIWHVRNEIVHLKPAPSIESSKRFLCSYIDSIMSIKDDPYVDVVKGKMVMQAHGWRKSKEHTQENKRDAKVQRKWQLPPPGWVKLNVDGSFMQHDGDGAAGMVLRDDRGDIIFSSCRYLSTCSSALEAELAATMEGIALAKQWSNAPLIVETDASEVIRLVTSTVGDRSSLSFLVEETKHLILEHPQIKLVQIKRSQNLVSHTMASFSRSEKRSAVWLQSGPANIPTLCRGDCNLMS